MASGMVCVGPKCLLRRLARWVKLESLGRFSMPVVPRIILRWIAIMFLAASYAGEPPPAQDMQPAPLPSIEQRVRDAELIVRLHVEAKKHEAVGRIVEVLKGVYDPKSYPDDPKGYFAFGIPASQFKMDHEEEIWFLGKSEILNAPADSQPDPEVIVFRGAKCYRDRLEMPVRHGAVSFPTVGRRYHGEVLETRSYKAGEFLSQIRAAVKTPSDQ
jgi:hypothetical protein